MTIVLYAWILVFSFYHEVTLYCLFPEQFQNSVWIDSDKGPLTFSTTNMTGWEFQTSIGNLYEEWECFHTSIDEIKLYLIMVLSENITLHDKEYTAYLCMEMTKITSQSYYYYLLWAEEEKYRDERISTTDSSVAVNDPVQQLCFSTNNAAQAAEFPENGEYHILVKQGSELLAKQECPSAFFGEFYYTITDSDTEADYCGTGDEVWDVCADYERMAFNYTICNTTISYSENGSAFCMFSLTSGSYIYHTLYNEDNTVNPSRGTHRFTCMVSDKRTDGSLIISQTPGSCKKGQIPSVQPMFTYNKSAAGLNIQLAPRRLCPKQVAEKTDKNLSTGAIAGIVVGIIVLIISINAIMVVCFKIKCRRHRLKTKQKSSSSCAQNKSEVMSEGDVNEMPYNQINKGKPYLNGMHTLQSYTNTLATPEQTFEKDITGKEHSQLNDISKFDSVVYELSEADHKKTDQRSNPNDHCGRGTSEQIEEDEIDNQNVPCIVSQECKEKDSSESILAYDIVNTLESNDVENIEENKNSDIVVTRLTKTDNPLRNDMTHLNSTENMFPDSYDAAMTYKVQNYSISKSDVSIIIKCKENKNNKKNVSEFSRDDSGLDMQSDSKLRNELNAQERMYKSEGNLADCVGKETLKRKLSMVSKISNNPLEWNFRYRSPYALSDKQKQDIIDRKLKLQKRKKQMEIRRQREKEKRLQENREAFEKWKQSKMNATTAKAKGSETVLKTTKSTFWYPT